MYVSSYMIAQVIISSYEGVNTYISLPEWLGLFDSVANSSCLKLIIGNKCDKKYEKEEL